MTTNVYIGWDSREPIAADVCAYSIQQNASHPVKIEMLKQDTLRERLLYTRPRDVDASTEFTFTRFLVPRLNDYQGWAVFCDCDFLWLGDIQELIAQADDRYAVMLVKHDYRPQNTVKMDGKKQEYYPRKNWSSMMLFNCSHPKNSWLTPYHINNATGQELHRFSWLDDADIGELRPEWNWLVGWYHQPWDGTPKALHYTEGGPWFENYVNCEYSDVWKEYEDDLRSRHVSHDMNDIGDLDYPDSLKSLLKELVWSMQDPANNYGKNPNGFDDICQRMLRLIQDPEQQQLVGICEMEDNSTKAVEKGINYDGIVHSFVTGAMGRISPWIDVENTTNPIALRSIAKRKMMRRCEEQGRDYYYIDTGYFGNHRHKDYHRVTKNAMQWLGATQDRPSDRLDRCGVKIYKHTPGSKILICPPSEKAMKYWDMDLDAWMENTIAKIKEHTDREIVVRLKQPRSVRVSVDTMQDALNRDVHCLVTFNSIAAVEALIYGKPVFTMGPNAAQPLANKDLSKIENPFMPSKDEVHKLMCCLSYNQFTVEEMRNGYAWAVLNGNA
jgi:lipopolysaccharide biosynthesis glycosyltransferase